MREREFVRVCVWSPLVPMCESVSEWTCAEEVGSDGWMDVRDKL